MTASQTITELLDATRFESLVTTRGGRVIARVSSPDGTGKYRSELCELDGDAFVPLTRGSASIGAAVAAEDGSTYFTAKRVGEDGKEADDAQLWVLPAHGEARELASRPGGFGSLRLVTGRLIAQLEVHSQARDEEQHAELAGKRSDAHVTAVLHADFPVRYWNQEIGASRTVLAVADLEAQAPLAFRYLDMPAGRLESWTTDDEGTVALVGMSDSWDGNLGLTRLYRLDLTGVRAPQLIADATEEFEWSPGAFSPDGRRALIGRHRRWTATASPSSATELLDLASGNRHPVWPEHDYWTSPLWLDDETLAATSDDHGRGSVWIGSPDAPAPRRLAGGPDQDFAFSGLAVAGDRLVAGRSSIVRPPHPVSIDPATGNISEPASPAGSIAHSGSLTEVTTRAADGTDLRAWLRLPDGDGPHPLLVMAHGGPWGSWNAWTFRWNPNPFVAAGYAVLLPDPAVSTGYGQHTIDRGQQELGGAPFTDILALADAAARRPDVDGQRQAFAGGSYGGYMANWVAGHTGDRFRCIVAHAAGWDMNAKNRSNDNSSWAVGMAAQLPEYSPHRYVEQIRVPMLVTHGGRDYRVPIAQAHELWHDLLAHSSTPRDAAGRTRHRFLYFPDEAHWILGRGNAETWYETVIAFLDEHVRGAEWNRPAELG